MTFPQGLRSRPFQPEYARLVDEAQAAEIVARVNATAEQFNIMSGSPLRAAVVIYLGLYRLSQYTERKQFDAGRAKCTDIMKTYAPEAKQAEISVNTSFFVAGEGKATVDHLQPIIRACNKYMPLTKSRKRKCFTLLALGTEHEMDSILPDDDKWLTEFRF